MADWLPRWQPFTSVGAMPEGPVWVLRYDPTPHPEGGYRAPKVAAATVEVYKRWRQVRLHDANNGAPLNLDKWPVIAWKPRERPPVVPAIWRQFLRGEE